MSETVGIMFDAGAFMMSDTPLEQACKAAERLRQAIADQPFHAEPGSSIHVTVSIGIAQTDGEPRLSTAELLIQADQHLYTAKQSGRDRVVC